MKKFSILSGAYINVGDYLIVKRTIDLLKYLYPNSEIKEYKRNQDLTDYLQEINKSDALIIAGGPAYKPDMYPDVLKLVENLDSITTKIIPIGVGWYGLKIDNDFLYKYIFTSNSRNLLDKIYCNIKCFSCRDWYSTKILKINNYDNCIMTGCPAWYNLEKINNLELRNKNNIKKICISDPANPLNFYDAKNVVEYLQKKYPFAKIYFVFHRIENDNKYATLIKFLKKRKINIVNITGNVEKLNIYDDCDLHIGFRVHAHIYNLSNRNLSLLIEEDGRGVGVNDALGLEGFKSIGYNSVKISGSSFFRKILRFINTRFNYVYLKRHNQLINNINNYLEILKENNYIQYDIAFNNMKKYFDIMIKYIKDTVEGE